MMHCDQDPPISSLMSIAERYIAFMKAAEYDILELPYDALTKQLRPALRLIVTGYLDERMVMARQLLTLQEEAWLAGITPPRVPRHVRADLRAATSDLVALLQTAASAEEVLDQLDALLLIAWPQGEDPDEE